MTAILNLTVPKRVPFVDDFKILGPNYTGATFLMQIRNRPGDTAAPLVSLANAAAGVQGISVTYNPAYVYNEAGSVLPASLILVQIDEATLDGLMLNNPADKPLELVYDLHLTPVGGVKDVAVAGTFTITPGVTI